MASFVMSLRLQLKDKTLCGEAGKVVTFSGLAEAVARLKPGGTVVLQVY